MGEAWGRRGAAALQVADHQVQDRTDLTQSLNLHLAVGDDLPRQGGGPLQVAVLDGILQFGPEVLIGLGLLADHLHVRLHLRPLPLDANQDLPILVLAGLGDQRFDLLEFGLDLRAKLLQDAPLVQKLVAFSLQPLPEGLCSLAAALTVCLARYLG